MERITSAKSIAIRIGKKRAQDAFIDLAIAIVVDVVACLDRARIDRRSSVVAVRPAMDAAVRLRIAGLRVNGAVMVAIRTE
jgi:hypothetical protein